MSGSGGPEEDITGLIRDFGLFTKDARFELGADGVETMTDTRLKEKARHLFKALGYENQINSKKMTCSVLRLRPGKISLGARSADLFPVNVWGNNPTFDGAELAPGQSAHINGVGTIQVEEESVVDLLYLLEKKEKDKGKKK